MNNGLPTVELITAHKYVQKPELDIHKDRYLHIPISTKLAIYAWDYVDKSQKEMNKQETK